MCISVPMKVSEIRAELAIVESGGVRREIGLQLLDNVAVGDWVLIHAGFAIARLNPEEAQETLGYLKEAGIIE